MVQMWYRVDIGKHKYPKDGLGHSSVRIQPSDIINKSNLVSIMTHPDLTIKIHHTMRTVTL